MPTRRTFPVIRFSLILLAPMVFGLALEPAAVHCESGPCDALRFTDVASEAGLAFVHDSGATGEKHLPETMGAGLAWLDFDGDGWMDLYVVQSGPFPPDGSPASRDRLYRNLGMAFEGRMFEDVTDRAGLDVRGYGMGALAADLDGDGDPDLYVTRFGPDVYLENLGDGRFADRTAEVFGAAGGLDGWSSSAAAADTDGDGDLDLYVSRYVVYDPAEALFCGDVEAGRRKYCDPTLFDSAPDRFFRRDGDLDGERYVDATAAAGLDISPGKGLGVLFADLDGDRQPDLYVANDLTPNFLFHNVTGEGSEPRFEDAGLFSGAAANREGLFEAGMGLALGDVDGDGDPDLAVTNFDVETNTLYRNLGALQFEDVSAASGFGVPSFNFLGFGLVLADLDLDGDLDAYAANGHIFERPERESVRYAQPDLLLLGDGRGGFARLDCPWLAASPRVSRGLAIADPDLDGDLDLAVSTNDGSLELWRNKIASEADLARRLTIRLVGREANTEAVGAWAELVTTDGRRQRRWVLAGDSYQSSSERHLVFGLGDGEPESLEIVWPSGERRRIRGLPANRLVTVVD